MPICARHSQNRDAGVDLGIVGRVELDKCQVVERARWRKFGRKQFKSESASFSSPALNPRLSMLTVGIFFASGLHARPRVVDHGAGLGGAGDCDLGALWPRLR